MAFRVIHEGESHPASFISISVIALSLQGLYRTGEHMVVIIHHLKPNLWGGGKSDYWDFNLGWRHWKLKRKLVKLGSQSYLWLHSGQSNVHRTT